VSTEPSPDVHRQRPVPYPGGRGRCTNVVSMAVGRDRRWVIRVARPFADSEEAAWYAGYGGLVRYRLTTDRPDAYRFDSFPDAVRTKEALLSLGVADEAEIEEV
jgi:hypothetical protein